MPFASNWKVAQLAGDAVILSAHGFTGKALVFQRSFISMAGETLPSTTSPPHVNRGHTQFRWDVAPLRDNACAIHRGRARPHRDGIYLRNNARSAQPEACSHSPGTRSPRIQRLLSSPGRALSFTGTMLTMPTIPAQLSRERAHLGYNARSAQPGTCLAGPATRSARPGGCSLSAAKCRLPSGRTHFPLGAWQ